MVLIGFMGAGKSTVGRTLAAALGWEFIDFDDEIERASGCSVAEIFERHGEGRFRALEADVARRLVTRDRVVLGAGGGWAAQPGNLSGVPPGTLTVWLQVGPAEALRRVAGQPGRRPLLAGNDPMSRAEELILQRAPFYEAAAERVDTEGSSVEDVTARVLKLLALDATEPDVE